MGFFVGPVWGAIIHNATQTTWNVRRVRDEGVNPKPRRKRREMAMRSARRGAAAIVFTSSRVPAVGLQGPRFGSGFAAWPCLLLLLLYYYTITISITIIMMMMIIIVTTTH